jgi:hypothetical protein
MRTQRRVFEKLSEIENKVELASEKIELALVDDLEKNLNKINKSKNKIFDEGKRISKEIFNYRDVLGEFKTTDYIKLLGDYQRAVKDLGVKEDKKYQKAFDDFIDVKSKWSNHFRK